MLIKRTLFVTTPMSHLRQHKIVGIIGCGWLGTAAAKQFLKKKWKVKGTARSESALERLEQNSISAFPYELGAATETLDSFFRALELLIIAVPPGLRQQSGTDYLKNLSRLSEQIKAQLPKTSRILFVSSTGVYPNSGGPYSENSTWQLRSEKSSYLWQAEQLFQSLPQETCVLRLAGLVGENREPIISLSKREHLEGGYQAANLIHQLDAARLLYYLGTSETVPPFLNGVFPQKIKKGIFYKKKALKLQLPAPKYTDTDKDLDRHIFSEIALAFTYENPV